ncbi:MULTISPECIES: tyrosine-type recombinase/integrase [unclassified Methylobacterium]|uniref:tyrosine-type recombinase/integrase n=1 Tax=unclassified Methylobacterium TaxID=2615210 RepID=UPI0005BE7679|nr:MULTISPECIES: tyrosine-type recombinase/integrase [unclassified Methylobacterium]SFU67643.1 Site-specific recombinase XerD [Methylobacterium sp. UNCCL125]
MTRVRLKGINTVRKQLADGSRAVYRYHRATGLPLEGEPGSPEFIASYARAQETLKARHSGETFAALVRAYTTAPEFTDRLGAATQREYKRMLTKAEPEFGDMPIEALEDPRVRRDFLDWRQKVARASGDREADNRLSAISAMLTWAVDGSRLPANHLKGFKRLYHADRSEIVWLPEHIAAFMAVAPIELQRALILALHTGQRQADILSLKWIAYDGEVIRLRQGKSRRNGKPGPLLTIPCTSALRAMLNGMERTSPLILTTKTGQPFLKRYFAETWEKAAKLAGLEKVELPSLEEPVKLHFHDLRGTAVTLLSEAGCTPQQIATITGHSLKTVHAILERYLARTRGLAEQAIHNFENSPRTKFANQLQTVDPAERAEKGKANV